MLFLHTYDIIVITTVTVTEYFLCTRHSLKYFKQLTSFTPPFPQKIQVINPISR